MFDTAESLLDIYTRICLKLGQAYVNPYSVFYHPWVRRRSFGRFTFQLAPNLLVGVEEPDSEGSGPSAFQRIPSVAGRWKSENKNH